MAAQYKVIGPSVACFAYDVGRIGPITDASDEGNIMLGDMGFIYPPSSLEEVA